MKDTERPKPDKIRVGFICDQLEIGGQERACHRLLQHLDRSRFAPCLFAFRPGRMLDEFCALQVPLYLGHSRPGTDKTWNDIDRRARTAWRKRLTQLLQDERIDVVVIFSWRDGPAAARAAGVRAIVERMDGPALADRIRDKSGITRVVCESRSVYRLLLLQRKRFGLTTEQVTVLVNSVDRKQFNPVRLSQRRCREALGIAQDEFVIGTTARLVPAKNIGSMIRAIAYLSRQNKDRQSALRLVVAGPDGGERRALQKLARELGIGNRVAFLGPRTDIPEILRTFDVFVSTSVVEGTPNSLLEAMAMALPVIATPVGGVPDLLDADNLVSPRAHRLLAKKLLKLWQEPLLRKQLGKKNRRKSAQFDVTDAARQFEQILIKAIRAGRRGPVLARRLLFISPAKGQSRLLRAFAEQLKKEKVHVKFVRLHDKAQSHLILQKLRRTSDPDLALVEDFETAGYVRHELKHIEIVLLQDDHIQLPHSPGKYAAVDHILFCSETSVTAAQNDLPFLINKIMPGHLVPGQKNVASKLAGLLEHKRNSRQPEGR